MRVYETAAIAALLTAFGASGVDKDKLAAAAPERVKLAWPSSPGSPAPRFVASITAAADVVGKPATPRKEPQPEAVNSANPFRLLKPFGIALDKNGRIFVADPGHRGILIYDRQSQAANRWTGNTQHPLYGPVALAFDGDGRLFVADAYQSQVLVFNSAGEAITAFGKATLNRPSGIAVDAARGRIYVSDVRLHQVLLFDLRNFALWKAIGGPTAKTNAEPGRFSGPTGLALNSKGELFVADMWNCRVQAFSPDGTFLREFTTECAQPGEYARAHAIAVDGQDRIYVADPEENTVQIFASDGTPVKLIAGFGGRPAKPFVRTGIAVDREDRIYLVEQRLDQPRVQIFAQPGSTRRASAVLTRSRTAR